MRKSGSWQSVWDDRILEYLRENGPSTAAEMKRSGYFDVSSSQISNRLGRLTDHGLTQRLPNGVYQITDEGEAYLDEEYDAEAGMYLDDAAGPTQPTAEESDPNGA